MLLQLTLYTFNSSKSTETFLTAMFVAKTNFRSQRWASIVLQRSNLTRRRDGIERRPVHKGHHEIHRGHHENAIPQVTVETWFLGYISIAQTQPTFES